MSRFIFAAFAFMVLFSVATAAACPENEVHKECGTACPSTCEDPNPEVCSPQCAKGCFCKDGLVRHFSGRCIPQVECGCDN